MERLLRESWALKRLKDRRQRRMERLLRESWALKRL
jgi:hypothetical protein